MNYAPGYLTGARLTSSRSPVSDSQLELGFASVSGARAVGCPPSRQSRASWWFHRMRQIVDRACDWQPVPPARPEQIWFPNTHRTISLAPVSNVGQRQLCE